MAALLFVPTSCAPGDAGGVAADCSTQVRVDGVVYTSSGFTERGATRYATADQSECRDLGEDAAGSVFPERPRQVTTWRFDGYSPERVLGVRLGAGSFAVFLAGSVTSDERDRITRDLGRPAR